MNRREIIIGAAAAIAATAVPAMASMAPKRKIGDEFEVRIPIRDNSSFWESHEDFYDALEAVGKRDGVEFKDGWRMIPDWDSGMYVYRTKVSGYRSAA